MDWIRNKAMELVVFCLICVPVHTGYAAPEAGGEDENDTIEIEVDNGTAGEEAKEEAGEKTEAPEKELQEETPFKLDFYGSLFYRLVINQIKLDGSKEYDKFRIAGIQGDILFGLRLLNNRDMEGRVEFNLNTDTSYYDFPLYNLYFLYQQPLFSLGFFHREWLVDFNDPLRLLDGEVSGFFRPINFYRKSVIRYALFGRDYYGLFFNYDGLFKNQFCLALPVDSSDPDRLFIIEKISKDFPPLTVSGNFILMDQDYNLPSVNEANWAEVRGVWYEFSTNTFYDPEEKDYQIKTTGELSLSLFDRFTVFGEAGIDHKYGGYYGLSSQKAASSGNIPFTLLLESPSYRALISAAGVQADLGFLIIEGAYSYSEGEERIFSYTTNTVIRNSRQAVRGGSVKIRLEADSFHSEAAMEIRKGKARWKPVPFDDHNFNSPVLRPLADCDDVQSMRSVNRISLGRLTLYPETEYRIYESHGVSSPNDTSRINTLEINTGAGVDFSSRLGLYLNFRMKQYYEKRSPAAENALPEEITEGSVFSGFAGLTYRFNENISIAVMVGLDPRIDPDYEYGYKYELSRAMEEIVSGRGDGSWTVREILDVEKRIAKNNYIGITGSMRF